MNAVKETCADARAWQRKRHGTTYAEVFEDLADVLGMVRAKLAQGRATDVAHDLEDFETALRAMARAV